MASSTQGAAQVHNGPRQGPEAKVADAVAMLNFARRTLERLAETRAFKEANLGVTEWTILHALSDGETHRIGQLSWKLGITPQRGAQIASALVQSGLIVATTAAEDTRKKDLKLTPAGAKTLKTIDEQVLGLFDKVFADKPAALANIRRQMARLAKELTPSQPE